MHLLSAGLDSGSGPPAFTANAISLPILEKFWPFYPIWPF
jgi:hypothetical protein